MFQRFDQYVSLSEGVICDLRQNNGRTPKYNAFSESVDEYIQKKEITD